MTRRALIVATAALLACACPAQADGPYEPNDSINQATGPLVGGVDYNGSIETPTDDDWFYLFTSGQRQISATITGLSKCQVHMTVSDENNKTVYGGGYYVDAPNEKATVTFNAPGRAKYYIDIHPFDRGDCPYSLVVNPADALTAEPPPPPPPPPPAADPGPSAGCVDAKDDVSRARAKLKRSVRSLRHAHRASSKRRLRKAVKRDKRRLTRALDARAIEC